MKHENFFVYLLHVTCEIFLRLVTKIIHPDADLKWGHAAITVKLYITANSPAGEDTKAQFIDCITLKINRIFTFHHFLKPKPTSIRTNFCEYGEG